MRRGTGRTLGCLAWCASLWCSSFGGHLLRYRQDPWCLAVLAGPFGASRGVPRVVAISRVVVVPRHYRPALWAGPLGHRVIGRTLGASRYRQDPWGVALWAGPFGASRGVPRCGVPRLVAIPSVMGRTLWCLVWCASLWCASLGGHP